MQKSIRICALAELEPGSRRVIEINDFEEVLVLNHNGKVYAITNICPHEGGAMQRGLIEANVLYCPLHRWGFDLNSGACVEESEVNAHIYTVEVRDADLFLCI